MVDSTSEFMTDHANKLASPLLRMEGIGKSFASVSVLEDVNLSLAQGEILALLGENGAGKSTLMKILCGIHPPTSGAIFIDGDRLQSGKPAAAAQAGIRVIHQEFNLIPSLTVPENLFLGQESSLLGGINQRQETARAREVFEQLGAKIPFETPCKNLTVAEQQLVEIGKALLVQSRLIVMDEPTAALSPQEVEGLFRVIRELKSQGIAIIYISHRLNEIFEICDRIMILRDGKHVATGPTAQWSRERLIEQMVGRTLDQEFPKRTSNIGEVALSATGLTRRPKVKDVSLSVRKGEIVALTGLIGSGRTEVARLLFGADSLDAGTISLHGKPITIRNPRQAIASGICLLTEDRKSQGLVVNQSVLHNFSLPNLGQMTSWTAIQSEREKDAFHKYREQLNIRLADIHQPARTLSGGNQQKVVLAKWLQRQSEVVIFDEPTRGIDVGAKYEIYQLMNQLVAEGKAILMISSELPEVLGMADRILVMHEGRLTGEITDVENATQVQIMDLAIR
ncbi:sugar ABC transporter ATP-binding protein [Thalassoglobus neptunius]|uniref:sugar ABC transporter ATP-binding protein n=1 Tax=Thalassoglobus neptunius TaxID=1938619 RepID=UPI0018D22176|nr:sugar ABC transporter ATP-binding protein [Thalassoglobus neptunius]